MAKGKISQKGKRGPIPTNQRANDIFPGDGDPQSGERNYPRPEPDVHKLAKNSD